MSIKERKLNKHAAGGPGKSARKGHIEPEKSGNKPSQRQSGPVGLPGEGRDRGGEWRKPDKPRTSR